MPLRHGRNGRKNEARDDGRGRRQTDGRGRTDGRTGRPHQRPKLRPAADPPTRNWDWKWTGKYTRLEYQGRLVVHPLVRPPFSYVVMFEISTQKMSPACRFDFLFSNQGIRRMYTTWRFFCIYLSICFLISISLNKINQRRLNLSPSLSCNSGI